MNTLSIILIYIANRGTQALTLMVFIGIFIPSIGGLLKPFITESIFLLLCISFLRIDVNSFKSHIKNPKVIILTTIWSAIIIPLLLALTCMAFNLQDLIPDLFLALMLQAVASPMMATPALAALMGLDSTLVLITMITSTTLIPFTVPIFAYFFIETAISISPLLLGVKLFVILVGSSLIGLSLQKIIGKEKILQNKENIDGINLLVLFVFVTGIMSGLSEYFFESPIFSLVLLLLAFVVFFTLFFLTILLFNKTGKISAYSLGFMVAQRNMGLMIAALGEALPSLTLVYFAISQFPIYLSPQILHPFIQKVLKKINK